MSKTPGRETPQRSALSPRTQAVLALIQGLLPALTAIIGGIWVAFTYLHQQAETQRAQTRQAEQEGRTRLLQAQKEFLDHQLNEYGVLAEIAARTVAAARTRNGDGFRDASRIFDEIYWGRIQIYADVEVRQAAGTFRSKSQQIVTQGRLPTEAETAELQDLARALSDTIRAKSRQSWQLDSKP